MARFAVRRHTRLLQADAAGIAAAAAILRAGGLVAFPTETVYGLGANALDAHAAAAIFEAKQRPANDPLIIHVQRAAQVGEVGLVNRFVQQLGDRFWPGPLTLVVPKRGHVPTEVTAGLDTVAVRVPAHPVAQALLEAAGLAVAAPSANLFGRPSPTRAQHVLDDLDGRIDAVVDGGPTSIGVESTIVDVSGPRPRLLRPGGVAAEDVEAVLGVALLGPPPPIDGPQLAPGLLPAHYAPRTPLILVVGDAARLRTEVELALAAGQRVGVVLLTEDRSFMPPDVRVEVVGTWSDPAQSATRLFEAIRSLDAAGLDVMLVRELAEPSSGLGRALDDRLRRAARRVIGDRD